MGGVLLTKDTHQCLTHLPPQLERNEVSFLKPPLLPQRLKVLAKSGVLQELVVKEPVGLD